MVEYKEIHIGSHIKKIAEIKNLSVSRACTILKCSHQDILNMYIQKTLDSGILLIWSKLLDYNFFMFYHTHLQFYKPSASTAKLTTKEQSKNNKKYVFRKNYYCPEVIDWILDKLKNKELSVKDIIDNYHIPRTTIYRWRKKANKFSLTSEFKEK